MLILLIFGLLYVINPVIAALFTLFVIRYVKLGNDESYSSIFAVCLSSTMAYIGYWARHGVNIGDIDRYIIFQQAYKGIRLLDCFDMRYKGLYAYDIFQWLCAKLSDSRLMIFFEVFIIYFAVFFTILSLANSRKIGRQNTVRCLVLAICLLPFYSQMSYMRSSIATSFIMLAILRDLEFKKKDVITLLCYAIGCMFHQSAWVFVLFRVLGPVFSTKRKMTTIAIFSITALIGLGVQIFPQFGGPVGEILDFANEYATGAVSRSSWAQGLSGSTYNLISRIIFAILILTCMILINKGDKNMI